MSIWREVGTVFVEEIRRGSSRPWYRVMTLAVPIILIALLIALPLLRATFLKGESAKPAVEESATGLVDLSGILTVEQVEDAGIRRYTDRDAGTDALVGGEIADLFVVREDYLSTGRVAWMYTGSSSAIDFSDSTPSDSVETLLREALISGRLFDESRERFLSLPAFESRVVQPDGTVEEGVGEASFLSVSYIFAFTLVFSIMSGGGFLLESVSDEKQNRMVEIILTSVSPMGMMTGKVLGQGALALTQITLWLGSAGLIGPRIFAALPEFGELSIVPAQVAWLALFFIAGYFVVAVVMAGLGAAGASYRESSQMSIFVTIPVILPLMLFQFVIFDPNGLMARVLSFIPVTAPVTMALRLGENSPSVPELLASLIVTVLGGIMLLWISARVFRAGILMYGQRVTIGSMFRALRQT